MTQGMIRGEVPLTTDGGQRWRLALGLLIGAWLVLGGLFHETLGAMARTWTVSASYNHGFLVLPISLWLSSINSNAELARVAQEPTER